MISNTSLSAFSVANGVGSLLPEGTTTRPTQRPHRGSGVQEARNQSSASNTPQTLQLRPGQQPQQSAVQPGQPLPRGSLLDLSV